MKDNRYLTYQTSNNGSNISGPEPNPSRKVVIPNVETILEQPKWFAITDMAEVYMLEQKTIMAIIVTTIIVQNPDTFRYQQIWFKLSISLPYISCSLSMTTPLSRSLSPHQFGLVQYSAAETHASLCQLQQNSSLCIRLPIFEYSLVESCALVSKVNFEACRNVSSEDPWPRSRGPFWLICWVWRSPTLHHDMRMLHDGGSGVSVRLSDLLYYQELAYTLPIGTSFIHHGKGH